MISLRSLREQTPDILILLMVQKFFKEETLKIKIVK